MSTIAASRVPAGWGRPTPAPMVAGGRRAPCGALVLLGLLTRLATVPLITIMLVAITSTKLPMLASKGFWVMAHVARTEWSMLLGSLYLLIVGAGAWSVDALLGRSRPGAE